MMQEKLNEVTTLPTKDPPNPQTVFNSFIDSPFGGNRRPMLSLVEAINNQNILFKTQQQNIESELKKLKKISESLLNENVSLRNLYRERTHDISKLLKSITINTNEVIIDYQHQEFLIKELNCSILKQIKLLAKQIESTKENIQANEKQCGQVNEERMKLQQQIVNKIKIKLKSQFNKKKIEEEKERQMQEIELVNELSSEVINIALQNKQLESIIENHKRNSTGLFSEIEKDKQQWKNRLIELKAENNRYRSQISNDEANLQRISEDVKYKENRHENIKKNMNEQIKKKEKFLRISQQCQSQCQKIKDKMNEYIRKTNIAQDKLDKIKNEKNKVLQKIKAAKEKMLAVQKSNQVKRIQIESNIQDQIRALRNTMTKKQQQFLAEKSKVRKQQQKVQQALSKQKNEEENLGAMLEQYNHLIIQKVVNPTKEIEELSLKIRLKKLKLK